MPGSSLSQGQIKTKAADHPRRSLAYSTTHWLRSHAVFGQSGDASGPFEQRSFVRSRLVVGSVYGVITAALVAGTTAFVSLDKHVTISVDGQLTQVRTYAASVDGVLHRAGITVGPHDSLTPAPQTKVHDGTTIAIARGRLLTLTIDGATRQAWVTGDNVDAVLQQAGLRIPQAADVSVDRSARVPLTGMHIAINLPHLVDVRVDGTVHSIVSTQTTLAGVLAEAGIQVNPADQVSSDLQTRPYDGMYVIILRISSGQELASSPIPFAAKSVNDPTLLVGTTKVTQVGKPGTMVATYQDGYVDGMQTTKSLLAQQVTVSPVDQVTAIGTKPKPKPIPKPIPKPKPKPAAVFKVAADGLNWKALADCEAGGRANASNPPYYGMYQFRLNTWHAVGGSGLPSAASASEQTYRAQLLYKRSNWRSQWPVCGHLLFT